MVTRPTPGKLSSSYGWRTHPITGARSFHTGSDYGHGQGTALVAPVACRVTSYAWAGGYGRRMVLSGWHGGKRVVVWLNHLADDRADVGVDVAEGELVAIMGTTGNSTGVHLHLEIFVDGVRVDPEAWLASNTRTATAGATGTPIGDTLSAAEVEQIKAHVTSESDRASAYMRRESRPRLYVTTKADGRRDVLAIRLESGYVREWPEGGGYLNLIALGVYAKEAPLEVDLASYNGLVGEAGVVLDRLVAKVVAKLPVAELAELEGEALDLDALAAKVAALVKVPTSGTLTLK